MTERSTTVTTAEGTISGFSRRGLHHWRGVPYAAPPIGERRFRAPIPMTPWNGVRDAKKFGNASAQSTRYTYIAPGKHQPISEDCLTLNIVAPAHRSGPLPVMVYIHGGAYIFGSSLTYPGGPLVRAAGVIYVSLNYRLGNLGYLDVSQFSTATQTFDSNLGLRDQISALEWVQRNIASFGGDPTNVTVFGESAGGNAVVTLLSTPSAHGLFRQAIAQSAAPDLTMSQGTAQRFGEIFVDALAGRSTDPAAALRSASMSDLASAGKVLVRAAQKIAPGVPAFGPVVDGELVPQAPVDAALSGNTLRVPLIIGTNLAEGRLFTRLLPLIPTDPAAAQAVFSASPESVRTAFTAAYPGLTEQRVSEQIIADQAFWAPSVAFADGHSAQAPTFMYRWDYATRSMNACGLGPTHGTELMAVFGFFSSAIGNIVTLGIDRRGAHRVTAQVQSDWATFAAAGSPRMHWPRYDTRQRAVLIINDPPRVEHDPDSARRGAWKSLTEGAIH